MISYKLHKIHTQISKVQQHRTAHDMTAQETHHTDFNAQHAIANTYTFYTNIMVSSDKFYQPQTYMLYLWWSDPAMPQP